MNIAFTLIASKSWMGGYNYLLNLLTGLARFESTRVKPFLFCGSDALDSDVAAFESIDGVTVVRSSVFQAKYNRRRLLKAVLLGEDVSAIKCFKQHKIDMIFETATFYGWRLSTPILSWVPDLQHKKLPELFPMLNWWRREMGFRLQFISGRHVLLSSESARQDFQRFYPTHIDQTNVLKFPARLSEIELSSDPCAALLPYKLPKQYVFLPNQFWQHKNHAVVIEALGILQRKGTSIAVVMTGSSKDPRHLGLFDDLKVRMEVLGVTNNIYILGMVPRLHLIALLQTCSALINPSKFEGWSTAVEEGKALGIPMILSNLSVHQEQAGEQAVYFDVDDAEKLAEHLVMHATTTVEMPRGLQKDSDKQLSVFCSNFTDICIDVRGVTNES